MKKSNVRFVKLMLIVFAISVSVIAGCRKNREITRRSETPNLPSSPYQYLMVDEGGQQSFIGDFIHDGSGTDLSDHSVTLGRVLFYDTKLSINNTISCGSCHKQALAFADNVTFSQGFSDRQTLRNSMSILNAVNNNNMFWDSRAQSPMELSLMPVFNHLEMGMENDEMLVSKLSKSNYYPALFQKAFGTSEITKMKISLALTQFINCLFSKQSKFDLAFNNFDFRNVSPDSLKRIAPSNFSALELHGVRLFFSEEMKCFKCHAGSNFSAPDFVGGEYGGSGGNIGTFIILDSLGNPKPFTGTFIENGFGDNPKGTANIGLNMVYKDNGKGNGQFKIPSLRNIELTGPYMHDGRFKTLEEVINHYSHGIQNHPNLDTKFRKNGQAVKLNISDGDKAALISFLKTLTDNNLITNPKFSDPFKIQ